MVRLSGILTQPPAIKTITCIPQSCSLVDDVYMLIPALRTTPERRICVSHVCGTDSPSVCVTIADYSRGAGILSGSLLVIFHN